MRLLLPLSFGLLGTLFLLWLGVWQMQRLDWKQTILADMDAHMTGAPVPIPADPMPTRDRYLPVQARGTIEGDEILVQSSLKAVGPGYRVIAPFVLDDGRRILIDRGFIRHTDRDRPRPQVAVTVTGNLHWPDELDGFTPDPEGRLWFARDVPSLAAELGTDPVLLIVRQTTEDPLAVTPLPVDTVGIPNNHLQYAVTWFLMAIVWAAMTTYLVVQKRSNREGDPR